MGCTPESFNKRSTTDKHNQLNQTLRSRHLHMIAIGGSNWRWSFCWYWFGASKRW